MMKKKVVTTTVLLTTLFAAAADAYLGQVVASFPTLSFSQNRGVARSASVLFLVTIQNPGIIYRYNPTSGALLSWYYLPFTGNNAGLAFSPPNYLWVGNMTQSRVYCVNADSGSIYSSWPAGHNPTGLDPLCTGDGGTGTTYMLSTDQTTTASALYTHNLTTGSIVGSSPISALSDYDFGYDWRNGVIWLGNMSSPNITAYSPSGFVMGSFPAPAGYSCGIAYANSYLYIGSSLGDGYIYVVHCPQGGLSRVAPASLGKVKALFR